MRCIKSFVRRERGLTATQRHLFKQEWPRWHLSTQNAWIDPFLIFKRKANLILEIGFGMGCALSHMAQCRPDLNYLGIEVYTPGVCALLQKIKTHQLSNIRIFQEDAHLVLNHAIPDLILDQVHIFFPDPWPKFKHHKRRLIQKEFIQLMVQKIKPGGLLRIVTDCTSYAHWIMKSIAFFPELKNQSILKEIMFRPLTPFEKRAISLGHMIYDEIWIRSVNSDNSLDSKTN